MAIRTYSAADLVQLPRYTVTGAIALGTSLQSTHAAVRAELSPAANAAADRLFAALATMREAYAARISKTSVSPETLRDLDTALDACWAGLSGYVNAIARVPLEGEDKPKRDAAYRIMNLVFADGLKFTQLPFKSQWAESETRITLLERPEHADDVALLGATFLVRQTKDMHQRYGDAQGLTKEGVEEDGGVDLRAQLDAFNGRLREYVVKVSALEDESIPATSALVTRALAPLASWESSAGGATGAGDAVDPGAAPAPVVTPTARAVSASGNAAAAPMEAAPGMPGHDPLGR